MNAIPSGNRQVPMGYLSEEHKRRFTLTAGILGAAFFIMQFMVPPMLMFSIMPGMIFFQECWMKAAEPERGTSWNNAIWYVETSFSTKPSPHSRTTLRKLDIDGDEGPESAGPLPIGNPWLLAGTDRLWIISSSAVGFYQNGETTVVSKEKTLGDISRPFLYEGYPAVIEERPAGFALMLFVEDTWKKKLPVTLIFEEIRERIRSNLKVLSSEGKLHLFLRFGNTLYYRQGLPAAETDDRDVWQPVAEVGSDWIPILIAGEPVVFHRGTLGDTWKIFGLRLTGKNWRPFFEYDAGITSEMGVYPLEQPNRFAILLQSFPGSLRLIQVDGTRFAKEIRHGSGFPFPHGFMVMMAGFYGATLTLPLILAVILSGFMRRHRICEHQTESVSMPFASLTRRALAQIVDFFVLGAPAIAGFLVLYPIYDIEKMFGSGPGHILAVFGLMFGTLLWAILCLFVFSFLEGKWGVTLGKWAVGIRVLGVDLRPCGFGRALVRNLLKFIDGFFNFMIGILLIGLTENWQRVGDMAARTVVIDERREEVLVLR